MHSQLPPFLVVYMSYRMYNINENYQYKAFCDHERTVVRPKCFLRSFKSPGGNNACIFSKRDFGYSFWYSFLCLRTFLTSRGFATMFELLIRMRAAKLLAISLQTGI